MPQSNNTQTEDLFDNPTEFFGVPVEPSFESQSSIQESKDGNSNKNSTELKPEKAKSQAKELKDSDFFQTPGAIKEVKGEDDEEDEDNEETEEETDEDDSKDGKTKPPVAKVKETSTSKEDADSETDDAENKGDKFYTQLVTEFKEKGIFSNVSPEIEAKLKKGEELTEEEFFDLSEAEHEARVTETVELLAENLKAPDVAPFINHLRKGGTAKDYILAHADPLDLENIDVKQEASRDKVLRHYLTTVEKMDDEDVEDRIKWLKEGGKEEATVNKYIKNLQTKQAADIEALKVKTEADHVSRVQQRKEYNESLMKTITDANEINGIKITTDTKKKLGEFFTKAIVKVGKDQYIPNFQAKLASTLKPKTPEDLNNLILLGMFLENGFKTDKLEKVAETKVTKKLKSKLQEAKSGSLKTKSTSSQQHAAALADNFVD